MNSFLASKVTNLTSVNFQQLACIKLNGFVYENAQGALAAPDDDVIGIVIDIIRPSDTGTMAVLGVVTNINTTAYETGQQLYCAPNGYLGATPFGPPLATVLSKNQNGAIYVNCASMPDGAGGISGGGSPNQVAFWNSTNSVTGSPNIKVNAALQGFDLGLGSMSGFLGPIPILDNKITPTLLLSYPQAGNDDAVITYSIVRDGERRLGDLRVISTPFSAGYLDDFLETVATGIKLTASLSAGNINIYYTSPNTGFNSNFRYSIRRWGGT